MSTGVSSAVAPFQFFTLAHVTRMGGLTANSLEELAEALEACSDESIYHHTIHAFGSPQYQSGSGANDFAVWVGSALNRLDLAEQLASVDSRDYSSITELRNDLCLIVGDYIEGHPEALEMAGSNAFCFCEGTGVAVPLDATARTLEEFRTCVAGMNGESIYLHLIAARSRHRQSGNDFSAWLAGSLGLDTLARKIDGIDVMDCTLEGARESILKLIDEERSSSAQNAGPCGAPGAQEPSDATIASDRAAGDRHEMDTGRDQSGH